MNNINDLVKEIREYSAMIDEIEAKLEALKDEIKAQMTAEDKDEIIGADFKVTWKEVNDTRFDTKTFKAENPEIYNIYARSSKVRRFKVSQINKG